MSYKVQWTGRFKKDYKLCQNRGLDIELLDKAIRMLSESGTLPPEYRDHRLSGVWEGFRECHIRPDWLLIYGIRQDILTLTLSRTETHSYLF